MEAASIILVLTIGNFLGALIKGITGFGSAILNLCVWILATCAGIEAGTLQQAVLTECIASEVLAIPLLCMTRAHATCDWALVFSLSIFGAVGAPIGAAMLTHLPPQQVEFAVGCLMLVVVLFNCLHRRPTNQDVQQQQQGCVSGTPAVMPLSSWSSPEKQPYASQAVQSGLDPSHMELPLVLLVPATHQLHSSSPDEPSTASDGACAPAAASAEDVASAEAMPPSDSAMQRRHSSGSNGSLASTVSDAPCICIIETEPPWEADREDSALLLSSNGGKQLSSDAQLHATTCSDGKLLGAATGGSSSPRGAGGCGLSSRLLRWWAAVTQPDRLAALRRMLAMGSLAGTAGGIMAGLTGMGGPPIMLMFERLQVPKDTVRGTNAVCNIIQVRIFAYIAMGVFSRADLSLYIAVSAAAVVGMLLGCLAAAHTNQATFSRMLTALMVLCCALMFASAARIAGNNLPADHHSS